jgi:hypothetical protein
MQKPNYITKASFRLCSIEERKQFHSSKCILPISIGYRLFEGEKLTALLSLINRSFRSCLFQIDDTLQQYTLRILDDGLSIDEAYQKALRAGDEWLDFYEESLQTLTIPYEIKRWNFR